MKEIAGLPAELPGIGTIVLPHLGNESLARQRDYLVSFYLENGDINEDEILKTDNPQDDIDRIHKAALDKYIEAIRPRMRQGEVEQLVVPDSTVSPLSLFEHIKSIDLRDRRYLLVRKIDRARFPIALATGTDRAEDSIVNSHGIDYEGQAMREYGLSSYSASDITYANPIGSTVPDINFEESEALLVYATEALQPITPISWDSIAKPYGIYAFVDPRLKEPSLLATVTSVK